MEINLVRDGSKLTMNLGGRIDTTTSSELEAKLPELEGVTDLVLNMKDVNYISSSGLRVLISMQNVMDEQGTLKLTNVVEIVMDIFEATGLVDLFEIE